MAVNRFAIATDGFEKPAATNWTTKKSRSLLTTDGYLNRGLGSPVIVFRFPKGLLLGVYK